MDRKDFYYRQRVTQDELDSAFLAAELADQKIVEEIMGYGFLISGPHPASVVQNSPLAGNVLVNSFLGYDQEGRRLNNDRSGYQGGSDLGLPPQAVDLTVDEVGAATTVAGAGNEKTLSIFVEFRRDPSDPRLDGNGATVYFLQDESVQYNVVQSAEAGSGLSVPPPLRGDQLLIADVLRIYAQTTFQNSDIDQSRRQDFAFGLTHGSTHVEGGADAIPNATTSVGGLESAADKTKLDSITWSATGVSGLFNNQAKPYQPSNVSAPSAATLDVTGAMVGKTAGGTSAVEGVVTTAPNNRAILKDDDLDDFIDPDGNKVYGRLTESGGVWTLSFYVTDETSGETAFDMTPFSGTTIVWYVQETYSLENLPTFDPAFTVESDQAAAEVPRATTTIEGKVIAAPGSPTPAQAGAVNTATNAGSPIAGGPIHTLNFPSGGATISPTGVLNIPASSGPPGPPGPSGPSGPSGPPGPGFSSEGPWQQSSDIPSFPASSSSVVFPFGFTVAFMYGALSKIQLGAGSDGILITNVTKSGTSVTVNYTTTDGPTTGAADLIGRIGCSAAG